MVKPKVGEPPVLLRTMISLKTTFTYTTSPALSKLFNDPVALLMPTWLTVGVVVENVTTGVVPAVPVLPAASE